MSRTRGSKLSGAVFEAKSGQAVWEAVSFVVGGAPVQDALNAQTRQGLLWYRHRRFCCSTFSP